jgi:hypothetical protein
MMTVKKHKGSENIFEECVSQLHSPRALHPFFAQTKNGVGSDDNESRRSMCTGVEKAWEATGIFAREAIHRF